MQEIAPHLAEILLDECDPCVRIFRRTLHGLAGFEGMQVDAYAVIGWRYIVLLDTLLCPADIAAVINYMYPAMRDQQLLCVNSHADWDHTWGNSHFSDIGSPPILGHELCRKRMNSEEARQELADFQARSSIFEDVMLLPPNLTFREGMTIDAGDLTIELLHAPGHCRDQIVAWLPELRLLLAFDAVEKPLPCIEDSTCAPLMFATLERLAALNAQTVLCSHGSNTSPTLIAENLAYLREIERRARLLLAHHTPTEAELEQAATLIGYSLDDVLAGMEAETVDRAYYGWAHEQNARAILGWLLNS